ncbi:hypothetical protein F511_45934 [Dorcoceras hygrometricum]|uniref:Uncharacterized protein n=1 Tax=Dorcoceras hygrometricum TaxID=472368 RepID=A0A2Z6ZUU9_9LAMI|nr:hypothetical protein F511_45934 [Dorcoceras hygrometricum]
MNCLIVSNILFFRIETKSESKFRPRHRRLRRRPFQPAARTCAPDNHARWPRMVAGNVRVVSRTAARLVEGRSALAGRMIAPLCAAPREWLSDANVRRWTLLLRAMETIRAASLRDASAGSAPPCAALGERWSPPRAKCCTHLRHSSPLLRATIDACWCYRATMPGRGMLLVARLPPRIFGGGGAAAGRRSGAAPAMS